MKYFLALFFLLMIGGQGYAQSKAETEVTAAAEQLRKAMIDGDSSLLDNITDDRLSYGHSGGHIDDKKEFVGKIASGRSDFVTIDITRQVVTVSGNTAIVRHHLEAATNDSGKPGTVKLDVMLVWQKIKGKWKLLARQAVKPS